MNEMKKIMTPTFFRKNCVFLASYFAICCFTPILQGAGLISVNIAADSSQNTYQYLIVHSNIWHYRYGTNAPQSNWKTIPDSSLDDTWMTGPAGFGYEDGDDATVINVMSNRFTTLYIRRTFTIDSSIDLNWRLELVMDYDDAFIAYIDGVEVARSANAPGTPGTEPPYNSVSSPPNHEALGYRGLPPEVYNLDSVGSRLTPGAHILAIIGFNAALNSSDFSLIPDLRVVVSTNSAVNGEYYSFVYTNKIQIRGTNAAIGSQSVTVNGAAANFNPTNGYWNFSADATPGVNRFFIAAVDSSGNIIDSTNKYVILPASIKQIGGVISSNTTIQGNGVATLITNNLIVTEGAALAVEPGAIILMNQSVSITVYGNSRIQVMGSESLPVYILPADGTTQWGAIIADGTNSSLVLSNAEIVAGQTVANRGAVMQIINSTIREMIQGGRLLITATNASSVLIKGCKVSNYSQIRFSSSPVTIEDSLFENVYSDGCDFADSSQIVIRRTTFRNGSGSNTDAIDLGNNPGAIIESVLVHNFPDKAVSIADFSNGVIVSNSLFYSNGIGISAYGSTNCIFNQNTIANNVYGLWLRQRYIWSGAGQATGTNNIIWGNTTNIITADGSELDLYYSDIQSNEVFPGDGNINSNPLFNNPDAADFSLNQNSPAYSSGYGGLSMGFLSKPGGLPAEPIDFIATVSNLNTIILRWEDNSENEDLFRIQISTNAISWTELGTAPANSTEFQVTNITPEVRYYFRVRAGNSSGNSQFSNISSAMTTIPKVYYGGILATNTVWTPTNGIIIVASNLIIPTNITLTVLPGTTIKIAANVIIRATNGGAIFLNGSADNPVKIIPFDTTNAHREISAYGTNSSLIIHFAEIIGAQATVYYGAHGLIEDSFFHNYDIANGDVFTKPIVLTYFAQPVMIRRCHFREYYELLLRNGVHIIEDCLFEYPTGDALDFDAGQPGTSVRRSTFRKGAITNVDGIDIGNDGTRYSTFITIENCIMYDFPLDKGVSIGDGSADIIIRNCLIYNCHSGIAVKDECTATIYNCTLISNDFGINLQAKYPAQYQGGRATNTYNNIIWGNRMQILVTNNPIIVVNFSDIEGTNWPGVGNISANPLFRDPANGDFRVLPNSPCVGTGSNGMTMGVIFPVGGLPAIPQNFSITSNSIDEVILHWEPPTNFHTGFIIERSVNGQPFNVIGQTALTNFTDKLSISGASLKYRICATNFIGNSFYTEEITYLSADRPIIFSQPTNTIADEGSEVSFAVTAGAIGGVVFQWYFNENPISQQTNSSLLLTNISAANAGNYFVVVSDKYGNSTTSAVATLTITPISFHIDISNLSFQTGEFKLKVNSRSDKIYILEATENLSNWRPIYTNSGTGFMIELIDPDAALHNKRFYRIVISEP
jgi:parallel beta-helix repeat protein